MTYYEITKKLLGLISPIGETHTDECRYKNLEETIEVVDGLLYDISNVSVCTNRPEASMSKAGKRAKEFLQQIADEIGPAQPKED